MQEIRMYSEMMFIYLKPATEIIIPDAYFFLAFVTSVITTAVCVEVGSDCNTA